MAVFFCFEPKLVYLPTVVMGRTSLDHDFAVPRKAAQDGMWLHLSTNSKSCSSSWILPQNLVGLELSDGEMRPPEAPETMSILQLGRLVATCSKVGNTGSKSHL